MKLARGEARKRTALAISFGFGGAAQRQCTAEFRVGLAPLRLDAFSFGGTGGDAVDPNTAHAELGGPGAVRDSTVALEAL